MADPVAVPEDVRPEETPAADVVMEGDDAGAAEDANGEAADLPVMIDDAPSRTSFLEYLKSPMIELVVGQGADATTVTAHQDLLTKSPYFEQACSSLTGSRRQIQLPDDDVEAVGSIIEYLYLGDYFPRTTANKTLESHPSIPDIDGPGELLLKHARIYTLAEKFMMPALKSTAHAKIHQTTSTARGEINYARYVYRYTSADDSAIRAPIAAFWAQRSHVLRHEAEEEFRAMCLEFPQFGFDVLSKVLDQREKRQGGPGAAAAAGRPSVRVETPGTGKGRKRARLSGT